MTTAPPDRRSPGTIGPEMAVTPRHISERAKGRCGDRKPGLWVQVPPGGEARNGRDTPPMQDTIQTGQAAVDHVVETWRDLGLGMVNLGVDDPWFTVSRGGADYTLFLSLADGTAVLVPDGDADADDVPDDHRPDGTMDDDTRRMLAEAFGGVGGGSYPLPDEGVFAMSFRAPEADPADHRQLRIGLLDGTVEIVDE